ncbi:hypothetical protein GCM10027265_18180 [Jatrophihabitans fulvus]
MASTPLLCGYCPVKIAARDGQHSELTTKWFRIVTPAVCMACTAGIEATRSLERSSVSTITMFGRFDVGSGRGWVGSGPERLVEVQAPSRTRALSRTTTP